MRYLFLVFLLAWSLPAQAEVTVWTDPDYGVTMTYPDGWMKQVVSHTGDRLEIVAPAAQDFAQCKLSIEQDGRFKIFPSKYLKDIVTRELGEVFWQDQLANHKNNRITYLAEGGGLGNGFATFVDFDYQGEFMGKKRSMRGVAYATIYHDMRVVAECSADVRNYAAWYPVFTNMMASITFEPAFAGRPYGAYRNFLLDTPIYIPEDASKKSIGAY
ncbi:MAG: hypothetical protein CMH30_01995 [Micavibrio sp.]|nr:hypothetical protein [Micavibrio sp.]|tara:strand:- start:214 stop:858 length:645 start_codon:yes stop_codon:yes gene_type:complete